MDVRLDLFPQVRRENRQERTSWNGPEHGRWATIVAPRRGRLTYAGGRSTRDDGGTERVRGGANPFPTNNAETADPTLSTTPNPEASAAGSDWSTGVHLRRSSTLRNDHEPVTNHPRLGTMVVKLVVSRGRMSLIPRRANRFLLCSSSGSNLKPTSRPWSRSDDAVLHHPSHGHNSVLVQASRLRELARRELLELVQDAWLARTSVRRGADWLATHSTAPLPRL